MSHSKDQRLFTGKVALKNSVRIAAVTAIQQACEEYSYGAPKKNFRLCLSSTSNFDEVTARVSSNPWKTQE